MAASQLNEALLEQKLIQLEQARQWSPRVISKLETLIRTADDEDLFRLNPIQFGLQKGVAEQEAVDLFLHATKLGLFEMEWQLICFACGNVIESLSQLSQVHGHVVCKFCDGESFPSLDDYIQVTFTIQSAIHPNRFRDPENLSIEDFYYRYLFAKGILPPFENVTHRQIQDMITKHVSFLQAHEKKTIEVEIAPGLFEAKELRHYIGIAFLVDETPIALQTLPLEVGEGKFQPTDRVLPPQDVDAGLFTFKFRQVGQLGSGRVLIEVENRTDKRVPLTVLFYPHDFQPKALQFEPFLSGKQLLTTQTFRDLFRSETIAADEGISVKDITFLFTDLKSSTELYDRIGDPKAYFLVRQHFDTLNQVIRRHAGAIVKTISDAIMATFMTPRDAVQAAAEMLTELDRFNQNISDKLILKIGIHKGHSIAVTLNDRLDYFGQTVNIAARVQGLADANEIYISQAVYEEAAVRELLADCAVVEDEVVVKGVSQKLKVYKVAGQQGA